MSEEKGIGERPSSLHSRLSTSGGGWDWLGKPQDIMGWKGEDNMIWPNDQKIVDLILQQTDAIPDYRLQALYLLRKSGSLYAKVQRLVEKHGTAVIQLKDFIHNFARENWNPDIYRWISDFLDTHDDWATFSAAVDSHLQRFEKQFLTLFANAKPLIERFELTELKNCAELVIKNLNTSRHVLFQAIQNEKVFKERFGKVMPVMNISSSSARINQTGFFRVSRKLALYLSGKTPDNEEFKGKSHKVMTLPRSKESKKKLYFKCIFQVSVNVLKELAANRLYNLIGAEIPNSCLVCFSIDRDSSSKDPLSTPVILQVTESIQGTTLAKVMLDDFERDRTKEEITSSLANVDRVQFIKQLVGSITSSPQDGKPENLILTEDGTKIIPIDNDMTFEESLIGQDGFYRLNSLSSLYALEIMEEIVHDERLFSFIACLPPPELLLLRWKSWIHVVMWQIRAMLERLSLEEFYFDAEKFEESNGCISCNLLTLHDFISWGHISHSNARELI
jgi:hypothetical protein